MSLRILRCPRGARVRRTGINLNVKKNLSGMTSVGVTEWGKNRDQLSGAARRLLPLHTPCVERGGGEC